MPFGLGGRRRGNATAAPTPTTTARDDVRATNGATASNGTATTGRRKGGLMSRFSGRTHGAYPEGSLNSRPTFGQWLKGVWKDIITMIILGAIGLGVYNADPAPSRSFPITFQDGEIVYPDFAYPLRHEIVPIWAAALLAVLVPIFFFLVCSIRVRSFWDLNNSILGLLYSVISAAVFQVFLKWLIGGLRPHFLAVCQPDVSKVQVGGNGFRSVMYTRDVCTGDKNQINDSLESFPSGHTTAAFAGFVYLYLYLNAKLKVFSNYHPSMWKLIAIYAPILAAVLIGGALTIDEFHIWYDILAGAIIGTMLAFSAYRMMYASVWDFRFNHIPLSRDVPFTYGAGGTFGGFHGFHETVFTRKAGWGTEESFSMGGAPFDASSLGYGSGDAGLSTAGHHHGRHSISRKPVADKHEPVGAENMV